MMEIHMQSTFTESDIREQAYYLWEQSGRPAGREVEFWSIASEALAAAMVLKSAKTKKPRAKSATTTKAKKAVAA